MNYAKDAELIIWTFEKMARKKHWMNIARKTSSGHISIRWPMLLNQYDLNPSDLNAKYCLEAIKYFGDGLRWFNRTSKLPEDIQELHDMIRQFESVHGFIQDDIDTSVVYTSR